MTLKQNVQIFLLGLLCVSVHAQSPFVCQTNTGVPPLVRAEGTAELVGDLILICTGGTPTAAGQSIPQASFTVSLNTNVTSALLAQNEFTEALLIVDEPASPENPNRPVLNCGNLGAPDNGPSGPGVCASVSDGNPADSYDGTSNGYGAAACDGSNGRPTPNSYSCGRPNVFQGRVVANNTVTFFNVPVDPPGTAVTRTFRITNIRANAANLGASPPNYFFSFAITVQAQISVSGNTTMTINNPQETLGYIFSSLSASPKTSRVRVTEGFQYAWKPKNISFEVGNGGVPGNGSIIGITYNGGLNYPPDVAQNVPGAIYYTESGFEWQNNGPNGPPSPNPPPGTDGGAVVNTTSSPLNSAGFGGLNTGISSAGVAAAGTRIVLRFLNIPRGASVQVPPVLYLFWIGSNYDGNPTQSAGATGVMMLTATDSAGAGAFNSNAATTLTSANNIAVYEILWADPFAVEFTEIPYTLMNAPANTNLEYTVSYAPLYPDAASQQASATRPVPRFMISAVTPTGIILKSPDGTKCSRITLKNDGTLLVVTPNFDGCPYP
jgi:hypothetical protein